MTTTRGPDLAGQKRSMLLVIERAGKMANGGQAWRCRCDCGKECIVGTSNLNAKRATISCGCYRRRSLGHSSHENEAPEFSTWGSMLDRCRNPNNKNYYRYGGRGIQVCERWGTYVNFFSDVGPRPSPKHSLDRIDVNGNYEPGNVRWATASEQQRNRRDSFFVPYHGKMIHVSEAAELTGLHPSMITSRHKRGWSAECLYLPPQRGSRHGEASAATTAMDRRAHAERASAETYLIDSGLLGRPLVEWAKDAGWTGLEEP